MILKNIKIKKRDLPSISEGRSLVPCFAAISVCVFCELGPKKISFLGDQPTKKRGEQEEGHRNQSFNRPGPVLPDSDIPLPLSKPLPPADSSDGPHSSTSANLESVIQHHGAVQ